MTHLHNVNYCLYPTVLSVRSIYMKKQVHQTLYMCVQEPFVLYVFFFFLKLVVVCACVYLFLFIEIYIHHNYNIY